MVFVLPVNVGSLATGFEAGRRSRWDDAERDTRLRQEHVRENIAVGTQDSNIFAANAQNTYRGNSAIRDDQFGAVTQAGRLRAGLAEYQFKADDTNRRNELGATLHPGQMTLGLAGQRNNLQDLNQNYTLSGASYPGRLADASSASDQSVANRVAAQNADIFSARAEAATNADLNNAQRIQETALQERRFIPSDAARSVEQQRGRELSQQEVDRAMRVGGFDVESIQRALNTRNPEMVTQYLQDNSLLPPNVQVVAVPQGEGQPPVLAVPDGAGNLMPVEQYLDNQYAQRREMIMQQIAQEERAAQLRGRGGAAGGAASPTAGADIISGAPSVGSEAGVVQYATDQDASAPQATQAPQAPQGQQAPASRYSQQTTQATNQVAPAPEAAAPDGVFGIPRPQSFRDVPQYVDNVQATFAAVVQRIEQDESLNDLEKTLRIDQAKRLAETEIGQAPIIEERARRDEIRAFTESIPLLASDSLANISDEAMPAVIDSLMEKVNNDMGLQVNIEGLKQFLTYSGRKDIADRIYDYQIKDNGYFSSSVITRMYEPKDETFNVYAGTPEFDAVLNDQYRGLAARGGISQDSLMYRQRALQGAMQRQN